MATAKGPRITEERAQRVLEVVDAGLCNGMGEPELGKMCVEAAVCFAFGEDHNDEPKCVDRQLRSLKIDINDHHVWSSDKSRAKGLRRLAVAQLGTKTKFDSAKFLEQVGERRHRQQRQRTDLTCSRASPTRR